MKLIFIDWESQEPILTIEPGITILGPLVPRKGEPVFIGKRKRQLVKYVKWIYSDLQKGTYKAPLERIEIILE